MGDNQTYARDPHLLDRKAVLEVYAAIINRTITDEMHQALAHEIFEHADAQGRLLAKAGNLAVKYARCPSCTYATLEVDPTTGWYCGDSFHAARAEVLGEIKRAMG